MKMVTKSFREIFLSSMLVFFIATYSMAAIHYVKEGGVGTGSSWTDASGDLQAMINAASVGDQVWVAAGTYKPTSGTDRSISFVMKNNLAIYGGFPGLPGQEGNFGLRDWVANVTNLSGEIGAAGNTDNSFNVILNTNLNNTAVLDGFTITRGYANGIPNTYFGGGMYNSSAFPSVTNCIFSDNYAFAQGGGVYNDNSSPAFTNCSFTGNSSGFEGGAAVNSSLYGNYSPTYINCSFINNSTSRYGGAVYNYSIEGSCSPSFTNCSFSGNSAGIEGGALHNIQNVSNGNTSSSLTNCIIWSNGPTPVTNYAPASGSTINYSIYDDGNPNGNVLLPTGVSGSNNLDADPLFVSTTDLRLTACSPALDAGDDAANTEATDLDGNTRKFEAFAGGQMIDMGAYEYQSTGATLVTYYTDADGDTYGTGAGQEFCGNPGAGWATQDGDCNDGDAAINPAATEICDGIDNNCNGQTDEGNVCCPSGNVMYVNASATGANNGTSWTDAYTDLQNALASSCPGITEIWVAAGTYKPTSGTDRSISFVMKNNLAIYGGFPGLPGQEGNFGLRDWVANVTNLSGDIGGAGNGDNSYHVIFNNNNGLSNTAVLDGFTITGGNAYDSGYPNTDGGGMFNSNSSPTVTNCSFSGNSANFSGGGMYNSSSSPTVTNCSFSGNLAGGSFGGGMYNFVSSPLVTNCSFSGNTAIVGGGMSNRSSSSPTVTNCSFSGNSASPGGGMFNEGSSPTVTNCILWGNSSEIYNSSASPTVTYSIVQGSYTGIGNLDSDPLFVSTSDLHLTQCSPALDAGDDAANSEPFDLDGNARKYEAFAGGQMIDMGAYEYQSTGATLVTYYTDGDGDNYGTGAGQLFCSNPGAGWATQDGDCNDGDAAINPAATEICDGIDNNCNGQVDEGNVCCSSGNILYVNDDASGANNGSSWADAFNDLQDALALANTCSIVTEIWVAQGTYKPTSGTNRYISFSMKNGVAIYGGFPNSGNPGMGDRNPNPTTNGTILSGNIGGTGNGDNSLHVINNNGLNNTAILDGFTISGGNASESINPHGNGGGMYNTSSSPTVSNCNFSGNAAYRRGGAVYNYGNGGTSSPNFNNCNFSNNSGTSFSSGGGAVNNEGKNNGTASPSFVDCTFSNNTSNNSGGAILNYGDGGTSSPSFVNCDFNNNSTTAYGGAIYNQGHNLNGMAGIANPTFDNCNFTGNFAKSTTNSGSTGGAVYNWGYVGGTANPSFTNCSFSGNSSESTGGAIRNSGEHNGGTSSPSFTNCSFSGNSSNYGGALYNEGYYNGTSSPSFINCSFFGNSANTHGGAMYNRAYSNSTAILNFTNCTFANNSSYYGGAMSNDSYTSTFTANMVNCILWGNTATNGPVFYYSNAATLNISYSLVQGANCAALGSGTSCGAGMIFNQNPLFFNQATGDLQLQYCSPAIDKGNDSANSEPFDLGGMNRKYDAVPGGIVIDMGAFERQPPLIPIAKCKSNPIAQLGSNGSVTISGTDIDDGSSGCGTLVFKVNGQPNITFYCTHIGIPQTVTLTVTDIYGSSNCTTTVNVEDNIAPNPFCKTATVYLDANGNHLLTQNDVFQGGTDNCSTANFVSVSPAGVGCANIGSTVSATVTADDNSGNTATCVASITVEDNLPPSPICKTATVYLDANGNHLLTENDVFDGGTDNCGSVNYLSAAPPSVNCANEGSIVQVNVLVDDGNGNSANCTANISVEDNLPPIPNCKTTTVFLDNNGNYTLIQNDVFDGGTDNCGTVTFVSMDIASVNCNNVWSSPVSVIVTATDGNGNNANCTANIIVKDNEAPVPACKTTTVQLGANGNYSLTQNDVFDGGTDNCTIVNYLSVSPASVDCTDAGTTIQATVTVYDASGNQATCTANVTVEDNEAPVAICPTIPDVVLNGSGLGSLPANIGGGLSTDNCSATETSPAMGLTCNEVGQQLVVLTVTDGFNTVTTNCSFNVVDLQSPVAHCPVNIPDVQLDANGNGSLPANIGDGSSTDNCTALETSPAMNFACADVGLQTVVLTASDGTNNSTKTCSFSVVDNVAPSANCTTTTINATLNSNAEYTVDPNELNENSTDACGIQSLSASPAILDCQHEGTNTVTLTVTDVNGNSATCTATIEVAVFLTIDNVAVTPESCAGTGDGSIVISATTGGGQLGYSIDGGANFQFSNSFSNLTPGSYSIVVKVFGIPAVCEKTATATIDEGAAAPVWYKDTDGDGYSDGNTLTSCSQPAGYIANPNAGTDCNDGNAAIYPGAPELCDGLDNDCDGIVPADELDSDGDGYRICDGDCDDTDAAVNPGATEICNGIDDDCDGQVDEGISGGQTYTGNVTFVTQADVDAWLACYSIIDGNLTITGYNITDLSNLINLVEVTGSVTIYYNLELTTLDGLDNLASVGAGLTIFYNFLLSDCCAIHDLINGGVTGAISIFFNAVGCNSVGEINTECGGNSLGQGPTNWMEEGESYGLNKNTVLDNTFLKVFPNPSRNRATIQMEGTVKAREATIMDVYGKKILTQTFEPEIQRMDIDLDRWMDGAYFIHIRLDNGQVLTERLIIMKNGD